MKIKKNDVYVIDIAKLEDERDSYLESLRQVQADFENYKKRVIG